jgi:hypothetical protein
MMALDRQIEDDGLSRLLTDHLLYAFDWILRRLKVSICLQFHSD